MIRTAFRTMSADLREKLHFLRGVYGVFVAWLMCAILVGMIGWAVLFTNLDASRRATEERSLLETATLARDHAADLKRLLDSIDQIVRHVRLEWQLSNGHLDLHSLARDGSLAIPERYYVSIIDRDGRAVSNSFNADSDALSADQDYFLFQKFAQSDTLFISAPRLGQVPGTHVIYFSRRIQDGAGAFAGTVLVSVELTVFSDAYDAAIMGKHGLIGMISDDGVTRLIRSDDHVSPPGHPVLAQTPPIAGKSGTSLLHEEGWFADARSRFLGWQRLADYPLTAIAALDYADTMAPYEERRATAVWYAAWATIVLGVVTALAVVLSLEIAWRKQKLLIAQASYRLATEEGSEGFYIIEPLRDEDGAVLDFRAVDCNQRGAEFFGMRRAQLMGRTLTSFRSDFDMGNFSTMLTQAFESGAHDTELDVPMGSPLRLRSVHIKIVRSDDHLAVRLRDLSDQKAHVEELQRRGDQDALTGLPNRAWVQRYLPEAIAGAERESRMLAMLFIDLDGFKKVNDTAGHAAGDELLQHAADRLKVAVRPQDRVVRFGGDEFVVLLEHVQHHSDAAHVAERVRQAFSQAFRLHQGVHAVGTSIGIAMYPNDGTDAAALLQNADIAMYSVKTNGKGGYQFFEAGFHATLRARLELEAELRAAVAHDEFTMVYQPRIDVITGATLSLEALVRWQHPSRGLLEPREFIALAEETGLIVGIGELVIDKVCAQLAAWTSPGGELVPVSVNVSPRQFSHANVADLVTAALDRHGVPARLFEVEITESSMMESGSQAPRMLEALHAQGVKILVDDFGTGYSSLSQLQKLDFDVLKVDQAFTAEIAHTNESRVFFTAIVTMAHALGMRVVAEGVESLEQVRILKSLDCDEIQGYYISPPLPPGDAQPVAPRAALAAMS
ncbi:bifunctional diguanylate cyclase/phosphodiesterase [Noviherbaspirillum pedocola]|uniref:EAL domain-containing protein n=1 Tax=Noviherbaspirillum pedocola TaxID=2801341 RepID=A0A934SQM1_9BURK|nr:EAL domain-containing protein [Noviherbaspirillum pedocola]MBK4733326.1 EAL domain-containing protein [Noviherbaspirillum pedocola]